MMKQVNIKLPFRMLALIVGLFLSVGAFAQITVKGHVKDAAGEPIIGATVRVLGTQNAALSDFDGNFTVQANQGADIQVTYMGYQAATVKAAPNVVVTLQEDAAILNDVVVIGYGRAKKSDLTGSVTAIKPDEKNHGLQVNAQDMIQGKIAGVSVTSNDGAPGGGATIRIRGGSSLNASNDPLIVIDGLAMDNYGVQGLSNPLAMVNPNDIESFTVLKDASATAIYGSRASNGVIIITTKKGLKGQPLKVSYNGNISIATKKNTIDVLDGPTYKQMITDMYGEDSDAYRALGWRDDAGNQYFEDTDWQDQIYRTSVSTDQNITLTGATKNMPYRVSLGLTSNNGIIKTTSFQRYTASFNLSPSLLKDHLKLNINGKGMYSKNRYQAGVVGEAVNSDPTKPIRANNTPYNQSFGGYFQWYQNADYGDPTWAYKPNNNARPNPVALLNLNHDIGRSKAFIGNIEADYAIHGFEDLHLHVNAGMDYSTGKSKYDVDPSIAWYTGGYNRNYYGYKGWSTKDSYNLQLSAYAQYMKEITKAHHIDIMAGYEWQRFHQETDWDGSGYYPSTHPTMAGERYNAPASETEYKSENYLVSFFGRLNYSLLDRYLITFTLRDDGSSRFSKGNKWGLFPSVALAWRMKDEAFLKNVNAVSDAKIRLGWGKTGQQEGIGDYTYIATYTPNQDHAYYPLVGNGATTRPDAINPDLTWEKTTTYNAGIDLAFLNNRLEFNLDWYYRKTTDLINTAYIDPGSNFRNKLTQNIGELHNTGIEFATILRPIVTNDWRWEVNYNVTYNKNKIDKLTSGSGEGYYVETGSISGGLDNTIQAHTVGQATSTFLVYQQVYDQNGKPLVNTFVDRNGNGIIDAGDRYYYYNPAPDVTMGLGSKLQYKGWDFSFNMRASLGNYVYNNVESERSNMGTGEIWRNEFLLNRTKEAYRMGMSGNLTEQLMSDYWVTNASFLKLDNITLGYSFDRLLDTKINGRIYATVQNVWTWTKYDGLDPEVAGGIDNNMYPRPFTTVLGLNLNF
ncbi:MAG: TonB-dependent receptor [Prevotella sp.]|nr:TonB-dependent receptor [Prevotella sp.]